MRGFRPFARGLSDAFVAELSEGRFSALLQTAKDHGLDIQVREHYIDVYAGGRAVLALLQIAVNRTYRARIHARFLEGTRLPCASRADRNYRWFEADDRFVEAYLAALPAILRNAGRYAGREAVVEEEIVRAARSPRSPVVFIDRQVQTYGIRARIDLVGLTRSEPASAVLLELKVGLDNRIQRMMCKLEEYRAAFAPSGCLRPDMVHAYRKVAAQKQTLGLLSEGVAPPRDELSAQCLVALYDYNPKSALLPRLRASGMTPGQSVRLVQLRRGEFALPSVAEWETLGPLV
jgi:hypothetical protein